MNGKNLKRPLFTAICTVLLCAVSIGAQTNEFTYQGKLTDTGTPSATYDFEFRLCDSLMADCTVPLAAQEITGVPVSGGVFTVRLNFPAAVFDGSNRWLEIAVKRPPPAPATYTTLVPREPITSTPYAIRALNATNAAQFDGLTTGDFVQNTTTQQTANFNVSGDGTTGGTLSGSIVNSDTQFNIGGNRVLSLGGADNLFAGVGAGISTTSNGNSFFGTSAGFNNSLGAENSFFGRSAGFQNTSGSSNSFFGTQAGRDNSMGSNNSFFGRAAGIGNTTGIDNTFVGAYAGQVNAAGGANSFFGMSAGYSNTGSFNSFFGRSAGLNNTTGNSNSFFGVQAGRDNGIGGSNSFFGRMAGIANTSGSANAFFGMQAGASNTTGNDNTFVGFNSGSGNTTGLKNTFVGNNSGAGNSTGNNNSIFGFLAGENNRAGSANSFFGNSAGYNNSFGSGANGTGSFNAFFGTDAGNGIGSGEGNVAVGAGSGTNSDAGSNNTSLGRSAGRLTFGNGNNSRNNNTFIGFNANGAFNVNNSTAIGVNAFASTSNSIVLGTTSETVLIPGNLVVTGTVSKGGGSFRIDHPLDPENKFLYHSFVESPDMMNVYNGNTTTDERGEAIVTLPDYFDALNRDFRYQLTVIGQFAQAMVSEEIKGNSFVIRTDKPGVKVSWQVTGIRKDKFANENRIQVEVEKTEQERSEQKPQQEK